MVWKNREAQKICLPLEEVKSLERLKRERYLGSVSNITLHMNIWFPINFI